jgi:hypothetical protein
MTWLSNSGWAVYTLCAFLAALFLAWRALAAVDFAYPLWYELLDIDRHIAEYGPLNHYRHDFEQTTKAERINLFSALVSSVQRHGQNLETLRYHDAAGQPVALLLTPPEIIHLRDVARLLEVLMLAGWFALAGWGLGTVWLRWRKIALPGLSRLLLSLAGCIAAIILLVLIAGPVRAFYRLHEWIFPPGHQWFFYYEDSLMTTLLKAPDLFAPIALLLLFTSVVCFILLLLLSKKIAVAGIVPPPDASHKNRKKPGNRKKTTKTTKR